MNALTGSLVVATLLAPMAAGPAEAALLKCGVAEVDGSSMLVFVDGARVGEFPMEINADRRMRLPYAEFVGVAPEDIAAISTGCIEIFDVEKKKHVGHLSVLVSTKAGERRSIEGMEETLLALIPRQEAYRAAKGTYAASTLELAAFEEGDNTVDIILMAAVATGWSARLDRGARSCHLAVGTAPPAPGGRAGEPVCTGQGPAASE